MDGKRKTGFKGCCYCFTWLATLLAPRRSGIFGQNRAEGRPKGERNGEGWIGGLYALTDPMPEDEATGSEDICCSLEIVFTFFRINSLPGCNRKPRRSNNYER